MAARKISDLEAQGTADNNRHLYHQHDNDNAVIANNNNCNNSDEPQHQPQIKEAEVSIEHAILKVPRRLLNIFNIKHDSKRESKSQLNDRTKCPIGHDNINMTKINNNNDSDLVVNVDHQNIVNNNNNCINNHSALVTSNGNENNHPDTICSINPGIDLGALYEQHDDSKLKFGIKLFAIFSTLYFFMWSSSLLSEAFKLTSVHYTGHFFRNTGILKNPLLGLMVGIITTVIVQSSGAITSVLITMVGSGVLGVRQGIPIIMGANVGTSVTNTIVSLVEYGNKKNFGIAITAGIVHDMQNVMTVIFMLPLELVVHFLERSSDWCVNLIGLDTHTEVGELQFLSYLVKPLVDLIIMVDTERIDMIAPDTLINSSVSLIKRCCNEQQSGNETICEKCKSLFSHLDMNDNVVSLILVIIALTTLFTCLILVVKTTQSMLGGKFINWISALAKREYQAPYSYLIGYVFIFVGMVLTIILHSSGVFTSMLVPLAGGNVLNLLQIYELTLGSNVGTTTTGIIAALSAQSRFPRETLQVALCHCIFNIAGIVMFYVFPYTKLPLWASKQFGLLSVKKRWFSIAYLVIVFLLLPALSLTIYFALN